MPLSLTDARVDAPKIDFAALRMAMPQVEPSNAMEAFKTAYEKAQSAKLEREMKALGLDPSGQPLRDSIMQDATYQPRTRKATGFREGTNSIYKPTRSTPIYTGPTDDALPEDATTEEGDDTTLYLME